MKKFVIFLVCTAMLLGIACAVKDFRDSRTEQKNIYFTDLTLEEYLMR